MLFGNRITTNTSTAAGAISGLVPGARYGFTTTHPGRAEPVVFSLPMALSPIHLKRRPKTSNGKTESV